MSQTPKFNEVMKHNAAIHIDTKSLTLTHRKAYNILLWNAWDEIDQNKLHTIPVWELCKMLGHHDVQKLYTELRKLPGILVEWNICRDDGWPIDMGACALLAGFRMVGNQFRYSFFEEFRPHLQNPRVWTKVKIEVANLFKSDFALALYETCNRYAPKSADAVGSSGWKSLDEWRKLLGVPDSEYYNSGKRIKQKIVIPAVNQVNKLSDIIVTPEYRRSGRGGALSEIKFIITLKNNYRLPSRQKELPGISKQILAEQITRFAPGENPAAKYLEQVRTGKVPQYQRQMPLLPE